MTNPTEQLAAWNQAAYDSAMNYARASLASAEQLLRLNLETARATLDQASRATRELMSVSDPQQFMQAADEARAGQHAAGRRLRAERVRDRQPGAARDVEAVRGPDQPRLEGHGAGAENLGKGAPGAEMQSAALKSTLAASSAMMESLNQATRQFAELSEATMKAAAAQMVKGFGKNWRPRVPPRTAPPRRGRSAYCPAPYCMCCPPLMAMFAPVTNAASSEQR